MKNGDVRSYIPSETHRTLYDKISEMVKSGKSYLEIGKILLPKVDPYRAKGFIYRGYKKNNWTKDNEIRMMLGLPKYIFVQHDPTKAPAPVCRKHGVVHCYDCESETVRPKIPSNPRALTYTRTRRARLNEIAREKGYKSWSSYETALLKEKEK